MTSLFLMFALLLRTSNVNKIPHNMTGDLNTRLLHTVRQTSRAHTPHPTDAVPLMKALPCYSIADCTRQAPYDKTVFACTIESSRNQFQATRATEKDDGAPCTRAGDSRLQEQLMNILWDMRPPSRYACCTHKRSTKYKIAWDDSTFESSL